MKKTNCSTLVALLLLQFFLFIRPLFAAEKYALIIGISNYQSSDWPQISSNEDVMLVKNALLLQGFKEKNIVIMRDAQCTRDAILKAINDDLTSKVQPGDVAVFHFSGHGQRIFDSSGTQQDGYDQSLACYNSPARFKFQTGNDDLHLRGAQLGKALNTLRQKLGDTGNLLVILDACHSGNGTRGMGKKRGVEFPYAPPNYNPNGLTANSTGPFGFGLTDDKKNGFANMVCFYACSPHQCNFEFSYDSAGKDIDCGSLSYAFQKELILADTSTSYNSLWNNIRADMADEVPDQTPQKEGNLDCKILGGKALPHAKYFSVALNKNTFPGDKIVSINCGSINGISNGTTVGFYPSDTRDTAGKTALCTGTVVLTQLSTCKVKVDNTSASPDKIASSWGYLENIAYNLSLTVKLPKGNENVSKRLQTICTGEDFSFVKINSGNADVCISYSGTSDAGGKLVFYSSTGTPCDSIMNWDNTNQAILKIFLNLAKWKFTKELMMTNPSDKFDVNILPVEYSIGKDGTPKIVKYDTNSDNLELHAGSKCGFQIELTNVTDKILYFNVLDIEPDGKVNVMVPDEYKNIGVAAVYPYSRQILNHIFAVSPPYGNEITKFICSDVTFDLSTVYKTRGVGKTPFEVLYYNVTTNKTRGASAMPSGGQEVTIKEITYKISP